MSAPVTVETLTGGEAEEYLRSVVHDPAARSIEVDAVVRDVDYAIRIKHLLPESMWRPARQRICDAINARREAKP